jgi:hypothetical protein
MGAASGFVERWEKAALFSAALCDMRKSVGGGAFREVIDRWAWRPIVRCMN